MKQSKDEEMVEDGRFTGESSAPRHLGDQTASWWASGLFVLALWLAGSLLLALVLTAQEGLDFRWSFRSSGLQCALLVALLVPVWLCLPKLDRLSRLSRAAVLLTLTLAVMLAWETSFHLLFSALAGADIAEIRSETSGYWRWLQAGMMVGILISGMVVVRTGRRLRAEEQRASQLQLLMREAELRALRAQLRPHFLFNTLNSIYSLIPERPEQAATMVALLSDLMRETLELTDQTLVSLDSELNLVGKYLEIESVRFGDRLSVEVEADAEARGALVPPLLLQPLVENAVHHGIARRAEAGTIRVEARKTDASSGDEGEAWLRLLVSDDGCGFCMNGDAHADSDSNGHGNGLRITRSRLANQFGEHFRFEIGPLHQPLGGNTGAAETASGTAVKIEIPYRLGPPDDSMAGARLR